MVSSPPAWHSPLSEHPRCPALHPHLGRAGLHRGVGAGSCRGRGNQFPAVLTVGKVPAWGEKPVWHVGRAAPRRNPPSLPRPGPHRQPGRRVAAVPWHPLSPSPCEQHPSPRIPHGLAFAAHMGQELARTEHPPQGYPGSASIPHPRDPGSSSSAAGEGITPPPALAAAALEILRMLMCREQDKPQRWARCAGSLHASLSSPLGIACEKGKGGIGDHRGRQGPGGEGWGRQGGPAVGFIPLKSGCGRVGMGFWVQPPPRHQPRERSISSHMEKGGSLNLFNNGAAP